MRRKELKPLKQSREVDAKVNPVLGADAPVPSLQSCPSALSSFLTCTLASHLFWTTASVSHSQSQWTQRAVQVLNEVVGQLEQQGASQQDFNEQTYASLARAMAQNKAKTLQGRQFMAQEIKSYVGSHPVGSRAFNPAPALQEELFTGKSYPVGPPPGSARNHPAGHSSGFNPQRDLTGELFTGKSYPVGKHPDNDRLSPGKRGRNERVRVFGGSNQRAYNQF
ncbi:hypothetical protein JCM11641_002911 [Rhodosporidiobolus odoratus]